PSRTAGRVQTLTFSYTAHDGAERTAYLVLPAWYGSDRHPPIPLVISPHGRGVDGGYNLRFWGDVPADGPFAVVSPDGQEHRLPALARTELGGSPTQIPRAYAARSPASSTQAIAGSGVPLQLWWSHADAVVTDQARQTGVFYGRLRAAAPRAPVQQVVGHW